MLNHSQRGTVTRSKFWTGIWLLRKDASLHGSRCLKAVFMPKHSGLTPHIKSWIGIKKLSISECDLYSYRYRFVSCMSSGRLWSRANLWLLILSSPLCHLHLFHVMPVIVRLVWKLYGISGGKNGIGVVKNFHGWSVVWLKKASRRDFVGIMLGGNVRAGIEESAWARC